MSTIQNSARKREEKRHVTTVLLPPPPKIALPAPTLRTVRGDHDDPAESADAHQTSPHQKDSEGSISHQARPIYSVHTSKTRHFRQELGHIRSE